MTTKMQARERKRSPRRVHDDESAREEKKWPSWRAHDDENRREKKKTVAIER
ncbi:hypothetical protein [Cytobacillus oceanisediminis]|uniref:hypothetical protein n=1 Tax=Cytobacillus oceanisediminis TaxID=665099 RepID=UPI0024954316|nr:hypothetical protein [Cytobacillus oceanisediminis]